MANKIKTVAGTATKQILFATQPSMSVGVVVGNAGVNADSEGKKILKAGTPLKGSLEARGTAWTLAADSSGSNPAVGVLLHDVDVTAGNENGTALIFGFVDLNKVDSSVTALITTAAKTALAGKVTFIK